jgi:mono/diheme cytochrome c family protein
MRHNATCGKNPEFEDADTCGSWNTVDRLLRTASASKAHHMIRLLLMFPVLCAPAMLVAAPQETEFAADQLELFNNEVVGILQRNCLKCHSGSEPKGQLNLTRRDAILTGGESGPAVDADAVESSPLLLAINYDGYEMPPTGQLSPADIAVLTTWVKQGLPWPADLHEIEFEAEQGPPQVNEESKQFWSFRPPHKPVVPAGTDWCRNEIDAFIAADLSAAGLTPSPQADPRALIRRATYGLTGLPPELEDVVAFEAEHSPEAWTLVIDRLLESPHYGEKWGRHWLDLVRYAETNSYERDGAKPFVWRYRDYVIRSFNDDKPYDQFLTEQLAGDELDVVTPDSLIATGYYRLGRWDDEPVDPEQAFYDDLDDIVTTTSQTFLGLTVNCARCHDHKIDPVPQRDYYRMLAFFRNVRRFGVRSAESVNAASVQEIDRPEDAARHRAALMRYESEVQSVQRDLKQIEDKVKPDFSGVEHDEFQYEMNRVPIIEQRKGGLLTEREVNRYRSLTNRLQKLNAERPSGRASALVVKEDVSRYLPTHVLLRGSPQAPGEEVTPGFPAVLSPPEITVPPPAPGATTSGRRRALAAWLTDPKNPLTARVMVNRIWQYHFGRGIVRTTSDFGFQGAPPTHPELLDWLAVRFIEEGWSIKAMHRLIMNSATYQMSSAPNPASYAQDPTNDLFWRFDMRRLSAEEVRDSILWANGSLNLQSMFGPSIYTKIPDAVKAGQSRPGSGWGQSTPEERARRSIYIHVKRSLLDPVLESFDAADTDQTCPVRFVTTQPTQALGLMNSEFIQEQANVFARLLAEQTDGSPEAEVRLALQRTLQREPQPDEIERGLNLMESLQATHGMSHDQARHYFCLVALNLNEFIYLD